TRLMAQSVPEPRGATTASPASQLDRPTGQADTFEQPDTVAEPDPLTLAKEIVQFASDKGAADILLMDIRKLSIIADYFVICSGDNERQIRAISRGIVEGVDERWGIDPLHRAGAEQEQAGWVLLDYGGVIVHVFSPQMREFYRLERLWSEAATLLRMQ
ncbi:MAG: ribosome silencing factor, partial [Chloroflexota bacterium]